MELLPEVEQKLIKSGEVLEITITSGEEVEMSAKSHLPVLHEKKSTGLLAPAAADSPLLQPMNHVASFIPSFIESPARPGAVNNLQSKDFSSIRYERLFMNTEGMKSGFKVGNNFKFDNISTPGNRGPSLFGPTPIKERNNMSKPVQKSHQKDMPEIEKVSPEVKQNGFTSLPKPAIPSLPLLLAVEPASTPISKHDMRKESAQEMRTNLSSKRVHSSSYEVPWNVVSSEEPMDISWR